jgi:hypothetical protein
MKITTISIMNIKDKLICGSYILIRHIKIAKEPSLQILARADV